jgi:hypothetical protein
MSHGTAGLLTTMINRGRTQTWRKRQRWQWPRAAQKSYRLIHCTNALVGTQSKAPGIVLAALFEESGIERGVLPRCIYFMNGRDVGNAT